MADELLVWLWIGVLATTDETSVGSALATHTRWWPMAAATTSLVHDAAPPGSLSFTLPRRLPVTGNTQWHQRRHAESTVAFPSATAPRRGDDAVTGDDERATRLLEGRCEEAYTAVTMAEKETRRLLDELADTS